MYFLFNRTTLQILLHTLQVLYVFTLCDSTNINTIIDNHRWHATNSLERNELDYRVDVCRITKDANIEHL